MGEESEERMMANVNDHTNNNIFQTSDNKIHTNRENRLTNLLKELDQAAGTSTICGDKALLMFELPSVLVQPKT